MNEIREDVNEGKNKEFIYIPSKIKRINESIRQLEDKEDDPKQDDPQEESIRKEESNEIQEEFDESQEESVKDEEEYESQEESVHEDQKNENDQDAAPAILRRNTIRTTTIKTGTQENKNKDNKPSEKKENTEQKELEEIKKKIKKSRPNFYNSFFLKGTDNIQSFTKQIERIIEDTKDDKLDQSVAGFLICANMDVFRYQRVDYLVYLNKFAELSEQQKQKFADFYTQFTEILSKDNGYTEHERLQNVSMLVQCLVLYYQEMAKDEKKDKFKNSLIDFLTDNVSEDNSLFMDVKEIYDSTMKLSNEIFNNYNKNIDDYIDNSETIKKNVYYPLYLLFNNIPIEMFDALVALKNNNENTQEMITLARMLDNGMSDKDTFYKILKRIDTKILKTLTNIDELRKKIPNTSFPELNWRSFRDLIAIISKEYIKQKIETTIGKKEITNDDALKFCRENGISTKLVQAVKTCLEYQVPHNKILNAYKMLLDTIEKTPRDQLFKFTLLDKLNNHSNIIFEMMAMSPVHDDNLLESVENENGPWSLYYFDPIGLAQLQKEFLEKKRNRLSIWHPLRRHGLQKKIDFLNRELEKVPEGLLTQEARNELRSQQNANNGPQRQLPQAETNTGQQTLNNLNSAQNANNEPRRLLPQRETNTNQQQQSILYNNRENRPIFNSNLLMARSYQEYLENINFTGCCSSYAY